MHKVPDSAEKYIKRAWKAGIISVVLTLFTSLFALESEELRDTFGFSTGTIIEMVIVLLLVWGLYKKNRFCALGLLIHQILARLILFADSGKFTFGLPAIIFIYYFFRGTKAAFQIYKVKKENTQKQEVTDIRKKRKFPTVILLLFTIIIIIPVCMLIAAVIFGPSTEVLHGKMVKKEYLEFIRKKELLESSEEIEYWYSDGFFDFKGGFYFFTKNKLVLYSDNWENTAIVMPFKEILDLTMKKSSPDSYLPSNITVTLSDLAPITFPVSNEGDDKFYNRLTELWKKATLDD